MKRRTFITSLGAASASSVIVAAEPPPTLRNVSTDVLVIGGGTAGTIAAIQAGRLGDSQVFGGHDDLAGRVTQPAKALIEHRPTLRQRDHRLQVEVDAVLGQGLAHDLHEAA